jgi:hypothetical protein
MAKRAAHATTASPPTGLGKRLAGTSSNTKEVVWMPESTPWDDDAAEAAAVPLPPPAAVAIVLELARTRGLERLRSRFTRLCAAASLQAPPLHAVERWLLLSKWEETIARPSSTKPDPLFPCEAPGDVATAKEEEKKKKKKKKKRTSEVASSSEPPGEERASASGTADAALADDLERAGLPLGAATHLVAALRRHSVALAEGIFRLAGCLDRLPAAQTGRTPPIRSVSADETGTTLRLSLRPSEIEVGWVAVAYSEDGKSTRRGSFLEAAAAVVDAAEAVAEAGAQGEDEAEDAHVELCTELSAEVSVLVTSAVVDKLRVLYARHQRRLDATSSASTSSAAAGPAAVVDARLTAAAFDARLFCCLLRYQSIGGAGFQAGLGGVVFRELQASLGCCFEGFASPLNTYYGAHCSAFADVDAPFGSRGSFAAFAPSCGSMQLNPPFVPAIIDAMAERVIALLSAAQRAGAPLAFTIVLPGWTDCEGYQRLGGDAHAADAAYAADAADAAVAAAVDAAIADAATDADDAHADGNDVRHPFLRASMLLAAADHGFVNRRLLLSMHVLTTTPSLPTGSSTAPRIADRARTASHPTTRASLCFRRTRRLPSGPPRRLSWSGSAVRLRRAHLRMRSCATWHRASACTAAAARVSRGVAR